VKYEKAREIFSQVSVMIQGNKILRLACLKHSAIRTSLESEREPFVDWGSIKSYRNDRNESSRHKNCFNLRTMPWEKTQEMLLLRNQLTYSILHQQTQNTE